MSRTFLWALALIPAVVAGSPIPDFPFVIVSEDSRLEVEPDFVEVDFQAVAFDESSEAVIDSISDTAAGVVELLSEHEIPLSQLESTQVSKTAKRARTETAYNLEILGYNATQSFSLTLHDLAIYPGFINELLRLDGVEDIRASFQTTKEDQHKAEMIESLSSKARERADALAEAQSRSVAQVYGITTETDFGRSYARFSFEPDPGTLAVGTGYRGDDLVMMVPSRIEIGQSITAIYQLE